MGEVAFVALGANLGDRAQSLAAARRAIGALPGSRVIAETAVEETAPFGPPGQPPYLNQMLALDTTLTPHALLDALLAIERDAGRTREVRWGARTLDLDIVTFGGRRIADDRLTLPHPGLRDREFWQREAAELEAALRG